MEEEGKDEDEGEDDEEESSPQRLNNQAAQS